MSVDPAIPKKRLTLYEMIESQGYTSLDSMEGSVDMMDVSSPLKLEGKKYCLIPGVGLALIITVVASFMHDLPFTPFTLENATLRHPLGIPILAILIGMIVGSTAKLSKDVKYGCKWISTWFIPIAIICLGSRMNLGVLSVLGLPMLGLVVSIMVIAVLLAFGVGKLLGLSNQASYLLGVGSAVCGSSAILAVVPVSAADEDDVALAVGAVNFIGLLAMFSCVGLITLMPEMTAEFYGALTGATIHAVPQVVAAAESHGGDAATIALAVKLLRVTLLVPVVLLSGVYLSRRRNAAESKIAKHPKKLYKYIPWFVWGFVIIAVLASAGLLPDLLFPSEGGAYNSIGGLTTASKWLLAIAMAAIGLQVNIKKLITSGAKALLCSVIVWIGMMASAFALFHLYFG